MHRRVCAFFAAALALFSIFPCQAEAVDTSAAAAILMALVMIVIVGILFLVESRYGKDVEG